MHGHQLRLLAEREHVTLWTDITVGALYGAIKRLAAEDLIAEERTEKEGRTWSGRSGRSRTPAVRRSRSSSTTACGPSS